jgi:lipopolysaccharide transport system permease protein
VTSSKFLVAAPGMTSSSTWRDLLDYREVLHFLVWRDVKVRYRQAVLGVSWAVLQPLVMMGVFAFVFGYLAGLESDGVPYPAYVLAALLPWQLFANTVSAASVSLISNEDLIRKVYFPRVFVMLSPVGVGLIDLAIGSMLLLACLLFFGIQPTAGIVFAPLFLLLAMITATGAGLWLSALNARFRDIQLAIPFLLQTWFFASPIAYASSLVPPEWRLLYALNPVVGIIDGMRWSLYGVPDLHVPGVLVSSGIAVLMVITGWHFFHRTEHELADVL